MAIYRSQKPSWESSLRTHTAATLNTSTTPALASLDLTLVSTTGVRPSATPRKPKSLGLAATLRTERAERDAEHARAAEMGEEEVDARREKKRRREETEGMLLNFDYDIVPTAAEVAAAAKLEKVKEAKERQKAKEREKEEEKGEKKEKKKRGPKKGIRGDEAKRPKSADGWWVE